MTAITIAEMTTGSVTSKDGTSKLVEKVEQISFSAARAVEVGQPVVYVTERAVFRLTPDGLELSEIAPGLDLTKDVLDHMQFKPQISPDLTEIDPRVYRDEPLGLTLTDEEVPA